MHDVMFFSVFADDSRLQKVTEIKKGFREKVHISSLSLSSSWSVSVLYFYITVRTVVQVVV